jgi:hypothetical protein
VQTLSGTGAVQASGGNGDGNSGGGGGGRIAVYYEDGSSFTFANVTAPGGGGLGTGAGGSIVLEEAPFIAPASLVLQSGEPVITGIVLMPASKLVTVQTGSEMVMHWHGRGKTAYAVETSADLVNWTMLPAAIIEFEPQRYEARFSQPPQSRAFFRLREATSPQ